MFHSDEERNRNVDPYNESQQLYAAATTTVLPSSAAAANKRGTTCMFELGQFSPCAFDAFGFDLDGDFGGRGDSALTPQWAQPSATHFVGEPQSFATFTPEDKWPI